VSFANLVTLNIDEYAGLSRHHQQVLHESVLRTAFAFPLGTCLFRSSPPQPDLCPNDKMGGEARVSFRLQSQYVYMHTHLFSKVDIPSTNSHFLDGNAPDLNAECAR
jgi:6-phosphogluconolactonase/glucosamine-6-phosphate isomerase/deaminase